VIETSSSPTVPPASQTRLYERNVVLAAKGGGVTFTGTVFAYGSRMVAAIVLGRLLGAGNYGLYNLALAGAEIAAGVALLGLEAALVRYIAVFVNRQDTARIGGTIQVGLGLTVILSLLVTIGLFALAAPIAEQLFHEPRLAPLLSLACLIVPFLALNRILAAATRGFKKMHYTVIAQDISQPVVRLTLIGVFALTGLTVSKVVTAYGLSTVAVFGMLLYFLNRLFPLRRSLRTARRDLREILAFSMPLYLSRLIDTFGSNIQTVLLGTLNTVTTVGVFAAASRVSMVGTMFNSSIGISSMPIVSELHDRGEQQQLARFFQTTTKWMVTLNFPLFLIVLLFPGPILSLFGEGFAGGTTALTILAWANLIAAGTGIAGVVLNMTGNTSLRMVNSIVLLALTLSLNLLLIPHWEVMGAAIATLGATTTVNLLRLSEVFVLFRMVPFNASFLKPVVAGMAALAATWFARRFFHIEADLLSTALYATIILAVYTGGILLLGLSAEDDLVLASLRRRVTAVLSRS
jgi:O-antigen/teichoic acid export membrane protein